MFMIFFYEIPNGLLEKLDTRQMEYLMPTQTQMWPMHFQTLWPGNVRKMTIQFVKCGPCWIGGFLGTREKETKDAYQL